MNKAIKLSLLLLLGVMLQNNFPATNSFILVLPALIVVALQWFRADSERLLAVVIVCLVYGALTAQYPYAATTGLAALATLYFDWKFDISHLLAALIITVSVQLQFVVDDPDLSRLVWIGFLLQTVGIMSLSYFINKRMAERV